MAEVCYTESMRRYQNNTGFIRFILLIVGLVLVLSYFNVDIRGIIEAPQTQDNISYVTGAVVYIWDTYLSNPVLYFWNNIFLSLLWSSFTANLENIKNGQPTSFQEFGSLLIIPGTGTGTR